MKRWRFVAVFLLLAFVLLPLALPPALALAQSQTTVVPGHTPGTGTNGYQGLVPCGGSNASVLVNENGVNVPLGATECGLCDFGVLIQRIINYLIILALPLSAALFAWAGIKLLTAGDNTTKRAEAIKIFKDVIIGLLIALAGFLVVQTVLNVLVQGSQVFSGGFTFSFGQCAADTPGTGDTRPRSTSINQLFAPLSTVSVNTSGGGTNITNTSGVGGGNLSDNWQLGQGNATQNSIAQAAQNYETTKTSSGPGGGAEACVWAVNNVLQAAGLPAIDGNQVASMVQALNNGAGTVVTDQTQAQAGDLVIEGQPGSHVGICQNTGCNTVISNSSSNASFTWVSNVNFGTGYTSTIYRVNSK